MNHIRNVVVAGGDLRQVYAANALAKQGCTVTALGFDESQPFEKVHQSNDVSEIAWADLLIFPLGMSKDEFLNTPLYSEGILFEDCLKQIPKDCQVFGGNISVEERELAGRYSLGIRDYFKVEELTVANALLTAEAAIQIAMEQLTISLWKCPCLIGGYGRIGKLLAERLKAFGAEVTVAARSSEQRIWAECSALKTVELHEAAAVLPTMKLIFNTIPGQWLNHRLLSRTAEDCLLIELASKPYGIDTEGAKQLNRRLIPAAALPGKHSPQSAGELIAQTILNSYGRD